MLVSTLPPDKWTIDVLDPTGKLPISIFGYNHVAMDRNKSMKLLDVLLWTGLSTSLGEAKKAMMNRGVRVNRTIVSDFNTILSKDNALPNIDAIVIELGKFNFGIVEMCD